ncbi:MAG: DNA recombination protein RmuC [Zetaproteobacteria bacterium]|nr:DNA recombination protein RmuC [Zetaproteobacteria bacterium]
MTLQDVAWVLPSLLFLQLCAVVVALFVWRRIYLLRVQADGLEARSSKNMGLLQEQITQEIERLERHQNQHGFLVKRDILDQVTQFSQLVQQTMLGVREDQASRLDSMAQLLHQSAEKMERQLTELHVAVDQKLKGLVQSNETQLEKMRDTVEEKLEGTLHKRLNESFQMVSKRLEMVHHGLGQMQELSNGMGDLKRVLTNVKVRGTWAEYQLGSLLEQSLSPNMFEKNFAVKPRSAERVDFAVRLPGHHAEEDQFVYLPIDSKFPQESYQRLQEASTAGDLELMRRCHEQLLQVVKKEAKRISDKYIDESVTTPFAVLFLATEGLYAEVLREPGFADRVQREQRVLIAGPTSLSALLASLQVGFQTLSLQKQSGQMWKHLSQIRKNFCEFSKLLDNVHKKLESASHEVGKASKKSATIEGRLQRFEAMEPIIAAQHVEAP